MPSARQWGNAEPRDDTTLALNLHSMDADADLDWRMTAGCDNFVRRKQHLGTKSAASCDECGPRA